MPPPSLPTLVLEEPRPGAPNPYEIYLSQVEGETRRTMRGCLDRIARLLADLPLVLTDDERERLNPEAASLDGSWVPWAELRYTDTTAIRSSLADQGWSPSHVNKHLSALRRVLKEAWRLGLMDAETYHRAVDLEPVTAKREPAGRDVPLDELDAILGACDDSPLGVRDAALIALLYTSGLRRSEMASLTMGNYLASKRAIRVIGKGNKERIVPVSRAALPWLEEWLRIRGGRPGPLFWPLRKGGKAEPRHLSPQTIADLLERRRRQAGVALPVRPHDLRRTLIGDLLDDGVDLVTAQEIAGHASPATTSRYDRRGLDTKRDAVDGLRLPGPDATRRD